METKETLEKIQKAEYLDLQFTDLNGRLRHVTVPTDTVDLENLTMGFPKLDGSSIRGFAKIDDSDLVLVPDVNTLGTIPWSEFRTVRLICDIPGLEIDPRLVSKMAMLSIKRHGYHTLWGPEIEFMVLNAGEDYLRNKEGYFPVAPYDRLDNYRSSVVSHLKQDFDILDAAG